MFLIYNFNPHLWKRSLLLRQYYNGINISTTSMPEPKINVSNMHNKLKSINYSKRFLDSSNDMINKSSLQHSMLQGANKYIFTLYIFFSIVCFPSEIYVYICMHDTYILSRVKCTFSFCCFMLFYIPFSR